VQLELPFSDGPGSTRRPINSRHRIYVNRDLKMSNVAWVGFDMDYTLAIYHQAEMDKLSIDATVGKLIERGYPAWLADLHYPLDFAIRGLLIDKHLGNILKLNRFKIVRKGYHGMRELTRNELRALYYERKLRHNSSRYHWVDTLYALSEASAFATIIHAYGERGTRLNFRTLFNDIRECIDEAHRDGSILIPVMSDPARFLERDPELAITLHKLRSAGKRLFVLTNSRHKYTNVLLTHLLDGMLPDYPSYKHYFDVIVVAARKPSFFQKASPLMLRDGEELRAVKGALERGKIYEGGNFKDLQQALGVTGNQVLYVGDHIYGDMLRSKKDSAWRTAMLIPELEAEVNAVESGRDDFDRASELYGRRHELEDRLRQLQARLKTAGKDDAGLPNSDTTHGKQMLAAIRKQLRHLEREASAVKQRQEQRFHKYWGSLLKEHNELSLFGHQLSEYACIYTSRVSNLLGYSPHQYFRSPHNKLHHEL
jgi:5'-nucleotidase